jgi:hypothetical protein
VTTTKRRKSAFPQLCRRCDKPPKPGRVHCESCLAKARAVYRRKSGKPPRLDREEWLAKRLYDCVVYFPESGSVADVLRRVEARAERESRKGGPPTPRQQAEQTASFRVARVDAKGRRIPSALAAQMYTGQLMEFAKGDQGERYEVTAFDPVLGVRFCFGWAGEKRLHLLLEVIRRHPRFTEAVVRDREPNGCD